MEFELGAWSHFNALLRRLEELQPIGLVSRQFPPCIPEKRSSVKGFLSQLSSICQSDLWLRKKEKICSRDIDLVIGTVLAQGDKVINLTTPLRLLTNRRIQHHEPV
jgi:hypothetical protein